MSPPIPQPLRASGFVRLLMILTIAMGQAGCENRAGGPASTDAIVQALDAVTRSGRGLPGSRPVAAELAELRRLYQSSSFTPLWFTASGKLRKEGKEALERLATADTEGLRPEDYHTAQ